VWHEVGAGRAVVYVNAAAELAHRRLLASAASDEAHEALLDLLGALVGPAGHVTVDPGLVTAAREAIVDDHPRAGRLPDLADLLGVSPYRLSRSFSLHMGVSVTRYRNRVRVGRALDRISGGEENLAALAADLGFTDQAHLCRTLRAHVGHPPSAVRRFLARTG
jgi:AraC-like DNA-binding protein